MKLKYKACTVCSGTILETIDGDVCLGCGHPLTKCASRGATRFLCLDCGNRFVCYKGDGSGIQSSDVEKVLDCHHYLPMQEKK